MFYPRPTHLYPPWGSTYSEDDDSISRTDVALVVSNTTSQPVCFILGVNCRDCPQSPQLTPNMKHTGWLVLNMNSQTQGLRDLVLSTNSQTQAMMASMSSSIQALTSEIKDQIRRPVLKKRKVATTIEL